MTSEPDDRSAPEHPLAASRSYGIAFRDVWNALLEVLGSFRRWEIHEADPRAGTVRAMTTSPLGYLPLEGAFTLSLDQLGQTSLEIRFETPSNRFLSPAAAGRARRVLRRLDRSLNVSGGLKRRR